MDDPILLEGDDRKEAQTVITDNHYSHSVPSGKSVYYQVGDVLIVFSIPANRNIAKYVFGKTGLEVWELTRLWAPNGHATILSQAVAKAVNKFHHDFPTVAALVSYADPNVGHEGGIYRAASWTYTGQSEEGRYYRDSHTGQVVSRRKFHSGSTGLTKAEIEAKGYTELRLPGKHRFVKGLTQTSRRVLRNRWPEND